MKYIIYELVQPPVLERLDESGYHLRKVVREVLEVLDESGIETTHESQESALTAIRENKEKLKHRKLTVLPVLQINWEGEEI